MPQPQSPRGSSRVVFPNPGEEPPTIGLLDDPLSLFADESTVAHQAPRPASADPHALFAEEDPVPAPTAPTTAAEPAAVEWRETRVASRRTAPPLVLRPREAAAPPRRGRPATRLLVLTAVVVALAAVASVRSCTAPEARSAATLAP